MSSIAGKIRTAQDKDGMLRRALERIIQLYADKSHFIYELLQNAEDAKASSIKFIQYDDRLEVYHDGKPFTSENLQGLCDIGRSDKTDDLNQIGEFGVGFKSVFGICDRVRLYSAPENYTGEEQSDAEPFAIEICDFTNPKDIREEIIDSRYTTEFVFPYAVGKTFSGFQTLKDLNQTLSKKLRNLGITTLLFMKNLKIIEYLIETENLHTEGSYFLEEQALNDHCSLVSAHGAGTEGEEVHYLKFTSPIDETSSRTIDIAFSVIKDGNGNYLCKKTKRPFISVYFPTETESKLNFIVQGPYRTTPNRSSVPAENTDNIRLAKLTARLLTDSLIELRDAKQLNMSFVKVLPLSERVFDNFDLFRPLYETVETVFKQEKIVPCRGGGYVFAKNAKIARPVRLASTLTDSLLGSLINDGGKYRWLPTSLTETNREYEQVYRFLTSTLKIAVIRPEDLRKYFNSNPTFLPQQADEWIVRLYLILQDVESAFSQNSNENNMLTADIIKTSAGKFVAPYRKTEGKKYIPNVFLPSGKIISNDINFVDSFVYEKCRHFFDDVLHLQKPNEYEFFVDDFRKRCEKGYVFEEKRHIEDVKHILKYIGFDDYKDEIRSFVKELLVLLCKDGKVRNTSSSRICYPKNEKGINIEAYYKNIVDSVFFVDAEFYTSNGIGERELSQLGVVNSITINEETTHGIYESGTRGRQPEWWTEGKFRWQFSVDKIKEAVKYISRRPHAKDSVLKSQAIFKVLLDNEEKLCGEVQISGSTPNLKDETCELIKVLRKEKMGDWDGRWLFAESGELVSQRVISKHDLNTAYYGKLKLESNVYDLLGFKKTDADEVDKLRKTVPQTQLDAFFESELHERFGISSVYLSETFLKDSACKQSAVEEDTYPFPVSKVKSWEALKKHVAEMLCFADPVKYDHKIRSIRTSNTPGEIRAYLHNMYRYDCVHKYACQMCHESCSSIEAAQIFNKPQVELDPMNLCLCPNCARIYRGLRMEGSHGAL